MPRVIQVIVIVKLPFSSVLNKNKIPLQELRHVSHLNSFKECLLVSNMNGNLDIILYLNVQHTVTHVTLEYRSRKCELSKSKDL